MKALEILKLKLNPEHKQFGKLLGIQAQITSLIVSATARVRAADLRDKSADPMDAFLADVRKAEGGEDYSALFN